MNGFHFIPKKIVPKINKYKTDYIIFFPGALLVGGQGGHLPTKFFRYQRHPSKLQNLCNFYVPSVDVVKIWGLAHPLFYNIAPPLFPIFLWFRYEAYDLISNFIHAAQ